MTAPVTHLNVRHYRRQPRRLTAAQRVIERAEDRFDRRETRQILEDTGPDDWISLDQLKLKLKR